MGLISGDTRSLDNSSYFGSLIHVSSPNRVAVKELTLSYYNG